MQELLFVYLSDLSDFSYPTHRYSLLNYVSLCLRGFFITQKICWWVRGLQWLGESGKDPFCGKNSVCLGSKPFYFTLSQFTIPDDTLITNIIENSLKTGLHKFPFFMYSIPYQAHCMQQVFFVFFTYLSSHPWLRFTQYLPQTPWVI